ncbi:uncharacterized protein DUF4363 [Ruminiclostridium sufflavum DSM 19573]|uniref:Uncharacterized protein DUF4363 n=1 Tax=Ruminiclostridium sufflavum DSM 19573 TaxID=1121337 RepID=A0A318XSW0_9FIRM|nr:DUF4363 family protein [Ruminiclostridium sufflavum]PYG89782.1 uncharacterized protein DUF4363 [Ruminiclostridium sufflavum DSM 19573]
MRKININTKTILLVACLLLSVIIPGLLSQRYLNCSAEKLDSSLKNASGFVDNKQWNNAEEQLYLFEAEWENTKFGWTMLLDHSEIDNIDNSYAKSKKYIEIQDFSSASAELQSLRHLVLHIPQREKFSINNIF